VTDRHNYDSQDRASIAASRGNKLIFDEFIDKTTLAPFYGLRYIVYRIAS